MFKTDIQVTITTINISQNFSWQIQHNLTVTIMVTINYISW